MSGAGSLVQDSIRVESPLPGGVATLFRFLFNLPQWLQISAAVLGVIAGGAFLALVWFRRKPVLQWVTSQSRSVTIGLFAITAIVIAGAAAGSAWGWHYSQHDNAFCSGCHIMNAPFQRFTTSQHSKLECHSCHQQSIFASARQLYLWVAERPAEIGPHAKVPTQICSQCHGTGQKEVWQRIASTAGHRTHLESDSSALRGVQCVTCHGVEVHQFAPVSQTCAQGGCHDNVTMRLAKMQSQTQLHCVACHRFTAEVPALATRDSAAGTLRPGEGQCLGCHQMQQILAGFDAAKDPHSGTCGMCHNPHTQVRATDARKSCASAGCHAGWRDEPFHVGLQHKDVGGQCTLCHAPHQARVDASDCAGCHQRLNQVRGGRLPVPFDTGRALPRGAMREPEDDRFIRGKGDRPPPVELLRIEPAAADTFPHQRHIKLACITCHPSDRQHGRLSFEPPRGCQICHHQDAPQATCATCHTSEELAAPVAVTLRVAVARAPPRERTTPFEHAKHQTTSCVTCHTAPVTLAPSAEVAACASCHADHHAVNRSCSACHTGEAIAPAHAPGMTIHTGCDVCHRREIVAQLVPARSLCLTCHARQAEHYADRECTTCHFQSTPDAFRSHLTTGQSR